MMTSYVTLFNSNTLREHLLKSYYRYAMLCIFLLTLARNSFPCVRIWGIDTTMKPFYFFLPSTWQSSVLGSKNEINQATGKWFCTQRHRGDRFTLYLLYMWACEHVHSTFVMYVWGEMSTVNIWARMDWTLVLFSWILSIPKWNLRNCDKFGLHGFKSAVLCCAVGPVGDGWNSISDSLHCKAAKYSDLPTNRGKKGLGHRQSIVFRRLYKKTPTIINQCLSLTSCVFSGKKLKHRISF